MVPWGVEDSNLSSFHTDYSGPRRLPHPIWEPGAGRVLTFTSGLSNASEDGAWRLQIFASGQLNASLSKMASGTQSSTTLSERHIDADIIASSSSIKVLPSNVQSVTLLNYLFTQVILAVSDNLFATSLTYWKLQAVFQCHTSPLTGTLCSIGSRRDRSRVL